MDLSDCSFAWLTPPTSSPHSEPIMVKVLRGEPIYERLPNYYLIQYANGNEDIIECDRLIPYTQNDLRNLDRRLSSTVIYTVTHHAQVPNIQMQRIDQAKNISTKPELFDPDEEILQECERIIELQRQQKKRERNILCIKIAMLFPCAMISYSINGSILSAFSSVAIASLFLFTNIFIYIKAVAKTLIGYDPRRGK